MLAFIALLKEQIDLALCANANAARRLLASLPSDVTLPSSRSQAVRLPAQD